MNESLTPRAVIEAGLTELEPLFAAAGFQCSPIYSSNGSGGPFASAEYSRGDRRLELHFQYSLGMVRYHIGPDSMLHEDYMWALLGNINESEYPGKERSNQATFAALSRDIKRYAGDFLTGDGKQFALASAAVVKRPTGFARLAGFQEPPS